MLWVMKDSLEGRDSGGRWPLDRCLKWLPTCTALFALLFVPADLGGEVRNSGRYEHFKYHFWGYSYMPRNPLEAAPSTSSMTLTPNKVLGGVADRPLQPRYLCFLLDGGGVETLKVSDWQKHTQEAVPPYLFVSFTSEQFASTDFGELHIIAEQAARNAGVRAYWISCSCMPDPNELSDDVYRISDVVRGAHSVAIILGPPVGHDPSSSPSMRSMLQHWGQRIWTFPEVLLSPTDLPIAIYVRREDPQKPHVMLKRNFPDAAWADAPISRQLVDHYEGSIVLSPLELVTIALQCLTLRAHNTIEHFQGDLTYVLMGLLRRRPQVNTKHTAFQEFCRLSLANDSNGLLERLICLLPRNREQPWHRIDDVWDRSLWDISPLCQVDGVGHDDTVILGGGFAAPIRYKSFAPVNLLLRNTLKRMIYRFAVRSVPAWFIVGALMLGITQSQGGSGYAPITAIGWILMGSSILITLFAPHILATLYVGKTWSAQPWLFGFEGYLDIGEIETCIFGSNLGRLKWSPYSSELSRHQERRGECIGVDPATYPEVREVITRCRESAYGEEKLFTLVDTNLMTVTLFTAPRPPVALVLCGSEGGMQRALLCSYDWKTQTLFRETILRVDTMVLGLMPRVDRFRLGLKRPCPQVHAVQPSDRKNYAGV
ncbi:hypothetical protein BJX63DRAFT_416806 [Aspergillus granulosus]|uniref:Uncharacterized protein n=1 Tax=Aspergillus granulosus TaxID=176169 RepID=A0ABR4GSY7_9EURO